MKITATELRSNVYRLLDHVIESGEVLEIERKGRTLKIFPQSKGNKLSQLKPRQTYTGDGDELHRINFTDTWSDDLS